MVMIIVVVVDNIVHHTRSGWGYDYRNFNVCYLADGGAQLSLLYPVVMRMLVGDKL